MIDNDDYGSVTVNERLSSSLTCLATGMTRWLAATGRR